jgi:hypothetical protein
MKWALILALAASPLLPPMNRMASARGGQTLAALAQAVSPAALPAAAGPLAARRQAAEGAAAKLQHLRRNGQQLRPDPSPTVLTESEINAYLASSEVALPKGVRTLRVAGQTGMMTARARVNFDEVTAGARSPNPLLALFSGVHDVEAVAHASGSGGVARVHVDSIALDGVPVPRVALELFANYYLRPRHPNLGLDSSFRMPERIQTAALGPHNLTVTQR